MSEHPEHIEQCKVINWRDDHLLQYPDAFLLYSNLNGAMMGGKGKGGRRANREKDAGMLPGVCDLFLPVARHDYHGLYIEMKNDKRIAKSTVSVNQLEFIANVSKQGYYAIVCYGADEAIDILEWYLGKDAQ